MSLASCGPHSTGYVVKEVQAKLPYHRLLMTGGGEIPPFSFDGFLSVDPLILTYFLFHNEEKTQQYAASWEGGHWRHFKVNEATHSVMLRSQNLFKSRMDYVVVGNKRDVLNGGQAVLSGKTFRFAYPNVRNFLYFKEGDAGKEEEALFLVAYSFTGEGTDSASWFGGPIQAALEIFSISTGERLVFIDVLGNKINTGIQFGPLYYYEQPGLKIPYLLWQASVTEAFAIDVRSLIPLNKK
jgi:hypothetical protein